VGCWHGYLFEMRCRFAYGTADHCHSLFLLQEIQIGFGFTFLVLAYAGSPRQNLESRKMVVLVMGNIDLPNNEIAYDCEQF